MICRILLLPILTSHVCAAAFVVNVTQSCYQTEEKHNITLEWTFTTKPDTSSSFLFIDCKLFSRHKISVLYHVHDGVEVSLTQNDQFSGRVQRDKDALREGRIRLHVSRLRTEDSGWFRCQVNTDYGWSSANCQLNITASVDLQSQRTTVVPKHQSQWRSRSYVVAGGAVVGAASLTGFVLVLIKKRRKS